MSVFDPETFLSQSMQGALDIKRTTVPEAEYKGYVDELKTRVFEDTDTGDKVPILDIILAIPDEALKQKLGLTGDQKVRVTDSMFIELDAAGNIATGTNKNIRLGQLREAVGQNDPKKPWSPAMLLGMGPVMFKVTHSKANDDGDKFARVQRYAKA